MIIKDNTFYPAGNFSNQFPIKILHRFNDDPLFYNKILRLLFRKDKKWQTLTFNPKSNNT